jgi:hypothetical protein
MSIGSFSESASKADPRRTCDKMLETSDDLVDFSCTQSKLVQNFSQTCLCFEMQGALRRRIIFIRRKIGLGHPL